MLIRRTVVPAALLLALSAGCANNTDAPIDAGGAPESAVTSPAASPAPVVSAAPGETTLTGTVTAGVEPNCLLLKDGTGDHLLITEDVKLRAALQPGAEITVVGKSEPGLMTTCMQGKPFVVSSVAAG
jgi:hypothetical protein